MNIENRILLAFALGLGGALLFGPEYLASILATMGLYALLGLSLVVLGLTGQVSLGHAAFMGLGAYASGLLATRWGVTPWLGLIAGVFVAVAAALLIGLATRGLRGHFLALATLAWGIALAVCFRATGDLTGGASGMGGIPALQLAGFSLSSPAPASCAIWLAVFGIVLSILRLQRSRLGRMLAAVRSQELMAHCFGLPVERLRLGLLVVSAAIAALAGGLYAHYLGFISPSPFDLNGSIKGLMIAVTGGELSALGALFGTTFVEGLNWLLQSVLPKLSANAGALEPVFYGVVLIGVMRLFPEGLLAPVERRLAARPKEAASSPLPNVQRPSSPGVPLLTLHGVGVSFGGVRALDSVSFDLRQGEVLGLIGPNGAGKSTAFDVISRMNRRHDGTVQFHGQAKGERFEGVRLARSFQHTRLLEDRTVLENVMIGVDTRGFRIVEAAAAATALECLVFVGMAAQAQQLAGTLPLGERRLIEVARALATDPQLLLLDEPAAGLRHEDRVRLARLIHDLRTAGRTILLVEHDMDIVMQCADRIVVLDRGRVIAVGEPQAIRENAVVIEAYLGGSELTC